MKLVSSWIKINTLNLNRSLGKRIIILSIKKQRLFFWYLEFGVCVNGIKIFDIQVEEMLRSKLN